MHFGDKDESGTRDRYVTEPQLERYSSEIL